MNIHYQTKTAFEKKMMLALAATGRDVDNVAAAYEAELEKIAGAADFLARQAGRLWAAPGQALGAAKGAIQASRTAKGGLLNVGEATAGLADDVARMRAEGAQMMGGLKQQFQAGQQGFGSPAEMVAAQGKKMQVRVPLPGAQTAAPAVQGRAVGGGGRLTPQAETALRQREAARTVTPAAGTGGAPGVQAAASPPGATAVPIPTAGKPNIAATWTPPTKATQGAGAQAGGVQAAAAGGPGAVYVPPGGAAAGAAPAAAQPGLLEQAKAGLQQHTGIDASQGMAQFAGPTGQGNMGQWFGNLTADQRRNLVLAGGTGVVGAAGLGAAGAGTAGLAGGALLGRATA